MNLSDCLLGGTTFICQRNDGNFRDLRFLRTAEGGHSFDMSVAEALICPLRVRNQMELTELKSPQDLPDADVVIFDGNCRFCIAQVTRLAKWDGRDRLCYVSLHSTFVTETYPQLTRDELMSQMYVVQRKSGSAYGGASAIRYLSGRLPRLWMVFPLLHIPFSLPLWQWFYNQIAKRRYRIAGGPEGGSQSKDPGGCDEDSCKTHFR